jgi:hypothetical protein
MLVKHPILQRGSAVVPNADHGLDDGVQGCPDAAFSDLSDTLTSWRLQRADNSAHCLLRTVGDRVELHITMAHDVVMSQQCSGPDQALAVSRAWWSALVDRGWVERHAEVTLRAKRDRRASSLRET